MKKTLFFICLFAVITAALFAQQTVLPRLAVVEFRPNPVNERVRTDAVTVRNLVESQMVRTGRYQIIAREEIDALLAQQRIQASDISSTENIQKLQLQNISYIVTGSVDAMGNDYAITVRVLSVATGRFSHSDNDFMGSGSRELFNGVNTLMTRFVAGMSADEGGAIVQGRGTSRTYNIGDTGPAGGIIFYDRGFVSDGWRYLEAAPANAEFSAPWGAIEQDVTGTGTAIGSGRRNTQLIVEHLNRRGESGGHAAQICAGMEINGFSDWFLPSRDELNLMYVNWAQRGLGNFRATFDTNWTHIYWSSSHSNRGPWVQVFSDGRQGDYYYKGNTLSVRAVRAF